ncbi:uracil-DNA glycosylase [Lentilitoribacter sp. Alg239-R112]|uniref:uracil-DNA glycosylase n=1 Tax=Lentilitoribacter sp. Alg239-R112 TaxID=2305987 RepID=UPI0013A6B094|nr:uracil-DNA glycosylase [Lentilitoribacter sp. Alg239-R112]
MSEAPTISKQEAAAILKFYAEAGVVDLLNDEPIDRFEVSRKQLEEKRAKRGNVNPALSPRVAAATSRKSTSPRLTTDKPAASPIQAASTNITVPDQEKIDEARALAKSANSVDELKELLADFKGCNLRQGAKNTVFADGNPNAPIMFIGKAPGRDEDRQGVPFVGPIGQLFDKMLAAIDLDRDKSYITNIVPWRPPGNRTPVPHEIELCRPFAVRHIELIKPKLIVLMGNVSTQTLLETNKNILSLRGTWAEYDVGGEKVPTMPTLHPDHLIKNPASKRNAWKDLLAISARLKELT